MAIPVHSLPLLTSSPSSPPPQFPIFDKNVDKNLESTTHSPLLSLLDNYKTLKPPELKQIHALVLRLGLISTPFDHSRLLTAYALSPSPNLDYALKVFDQIPLPNLYTWNTLIRAYACGPDPCVALRLFSQLVSCGLHSPDKFTFPFVIKACSEVGELGIGTAVHGMVAKSGFLSSDVFIMNSLIRMYATCGELDLAYRVFGKIPNRDVVSWNSVIAGFAKSGMVDEALRLFREMEGEGVRPNDVTMVSLLSACGKNGNLEVGRSMCSYIERNDIERDLILDNAMLDMYVKCGSLDEAKSIFDGMVVKDSISWTTMLAGYARSGELSSARRLFDSMPMQDIASWNALLSGYEQNGHPKEALDLFHELQKSEAKPDQITLVAVLSACSQLGALEMGCWIHTYIKKNNIKFNFHLVTSLIDMYSKCGDLNKALDVFDSVEKKDVFVWSAMIAGLAMHGRGRDALELFRLMQEAQVEPNAVTFTNVLCACSHAGLVQEARLYLSQMLPIYGVVPTVEHYSIMVDILGRAGMLEEAMKVIDNMPVPPDASIWSAMLGACAVHKNVGMGEIACKNLLKLEPKNHGAIVLLSNLYAQSANWDGVARLRTLMKETSLKKEPGASLIEVNGLVHEFLVGDTSHPLKEKIYFQLDEIISRLKSLGYVPNIKLMQQNVEEHLKAHALYLHSEKIAIAFGLISVTSLGPIRVIKNLRICDDCHHFAKLVSSVYNIEIILRDRYRFHHFKGGSCSCMEYW